MTVPSKSLQRASSPAALLTPSDAVSTSTTTSLVPALGLHSAQVAANQEAVADALTPGTARHGRRDGKTPAGMEREEGAWEPEPAVEATQEGQQSPAGQGQLAGLGPANASAQEMQRWLTERDAGRQEEDDGAAGWLAAPATAPSGWLVAGGGLLAAAAVTAGGGGGGSGGHGNGIATRPPSDGVTLPPPQTQPESAALGAPRLRLSAQADAPVQGLPSTNDPVVQVSNLESDGAWFYRTDGQTWIRGQGSQIPASVFVAQGAHRVEVYQMDLAGNVGPTASLEFWHDSIAPVSADVALKDDTGNTTDLITSDATLVISGVQPGDQWYFSVNGGDWQTGQGNEVPDSALGGDGVHTISVVVRDPTGNESAPTSITVVRDTTAPDTAPTVSLEFDTGDEGDRITQTPFLLFGGLETGARWIFSLDDGQHWHEAANASDRAFRDDALFDRDGHWTVLAKQIDAAGNEGTATSRFEFELDRQAPDMPSVALKEDTGLFDDDRVTKNGTVVISGVETGGTWGYRINGALEWTQIAGMEIPHEHFTDGHHRVEVASWDVAGNRSAIQRLEFLLDTQAPALPGVDLGVYNATAVV